MRAALPLCALLLLGCHESLGLVGDARMDTTVDAPWDTGWDTGYDPGWDPGYDIGPEPAVDVPPDGTSTCMPPSDDGMNIDFSFDGDRFTRYDLTLVCTTDELEEDPASGTIELWLSCRSDEGLIEEHTLLFQTYPTVPIDAELFFGEELLVRYVSDPIFWTNRQVTVSSPVVGLLIAAVDAETLVPWDEEDWYSPLIVEPVGGVCPVEEDYCGTIERQALEVAYWDWHGSVTVFDGNAKPLEDPDNSYLVMVAKMHAYHMVYCEDVPYTWVSALIARLP